MKYASYVLLIILAGCVTSPPPTVIHVAADQPAVSDKPWSDGQATTYWIGRTIASPAGNVIHEAHPLFRLEDAGRPQLATPPGLFYPPGSAQPATNATYEDYEALRSEAARARDVTLKLTVAAQELARQSAALRATAESNRQLQAQVGELSATAARLNDRMQTLEQRTLPANDSGPARKPGELPVARTNSQMNQ